MRRSPVVRALTLVAACGGGESSRAMERQIRWMVTFDTALVAVAPATARRLF